MSIRDELIVNQQEQISKLQQQCLEKDIRIEQQKETIYELRVELERIFEKHGYESIKSLL